jgi:CubicO group peptidase (beta-lactamase class C family)
MRKRLAAIVVFLALGIAVPQGGQTPSPQRALTTPPFEAYLESLRRQAGIPGLSAGLVQDGELVWERGFGFQNVEARIPATPDTPYPVADLSQLLSSVLLLQCVEQRYLRLDDPARLYGVAPPESPATLRHFLGHMAGEDTPPGTTFQYSPERFSQLTLAIESCVPQPYRKTVSHRLLERLAMRDSVPGRDIATPTEELQQLFDPADLERYAAVVNRMAVPYRLERRNRVVRTDLPVPPEGINAAVGLISTVRDLARFVSALDSALLLEEETLTAVWAGGRAGIDGVAIPGGLGWFVQTYQGQPVAWHFGLVPNAYSSLIIRLPDRRLTLILLANSDGLTAPYQLHNGDVTRSVFANVFLRLFS